MGWRGSEENGFCETRSRQNRRYAGCHATGEKKQKHDGQLWMVQEVVAIICKVPMLWDIFITVNQSFWRLCSVSLSPTRSPPQNLEIQQMEQPTSSPDLNHLFSLIKKKEIKILWCLVQLLMELNHPIPQKTVKTGVCTQQENCLNCLMREKYFFFLGT